MDGDGDPDLWAAADDGGTDGRLFRNDGALGFTDVTAGGLENQGEVEKTAWLDIDNDGDLDLWLAGSSRASTLLLNFGSGVFLDSEGLGVNLPSHARDFAWFDLDNDGDLDLWLLAPDEQRRVFRNDGNLFFTPTSTDDLASLEIGVDGGWIDVDSDGDLDLWADGRSSEPALLENDSFGCGNHWLRVQLSGPSLLASGTAATVRVDGHVRQVGACANGFSACEAAGHFGLGIQDVVGELEVRWPDGRIQTLTALPADQTVLLFETELTVDNDPGQCGANVSFSPTASDGCPGVSASCTSLSGSFFPLGSTTVSCVTTDAANHTTTCSFTVTVSDAENPTIGECPADISVATGASCKVAAFSTPTTTDGCSDPTVACTPPSGTCFDPGTTPVTCTATDGAGLTDSCTFNVTVVPCAITCPNDVSVSNDPGKCGGTATFTPTITGDGCGTVTCTPASGSFFPKGTTPVTCGTAAGPSCSFTVTANDTEDPVIACPADIAVGTDRGQCSAMVNPGSATAIENCPGVAIDGARGDGQPLNAPYPLGTTTIAWTSTDASGRMSSCQQSVSVTDTEPPSISGAAASPAVLWPPNHTLRDVTVGYSATDNCGPVTCSRGVASNEPVDGTGDGDTSPDWILVDATHVRLRAERAGNGNGRIYTITITCADVYGNPSSRDVTVVVGHNITVPASGEALRIGTPVTFSGTFWDVPGKTHTAQWTFDGLSAGGTVVEPSGMRLGTVTGTYTFRELGVHKVRLNTTDNNGVTSYVTIAGGLEAIVVIYDPSAGYTVGGG
jgi:hypothetical protein